MGMFDGFKPEKNDWIVPVSGELINIEQVVDKVFSEKMMGDGFAINPSDNKLYAPMNSDVVVTFATKHAIGLKTKIGIEILLHIGIDTVKLGGEGFINHVEMGDKVKEGQLLAEFDLKLIEEKCPASTVVVIFTNLRNKNFEVEYGKVVALENGKVKLV